jgi:hypothetical protein
MRLAWLVGAVLLALAFTPANAFDHAEFCAMKIQEAEADQLEAGVWLDEYTRNESVSVHCSMRMIEFRRHLDMPPAELTNDWRTREKRRWNQAHCSDPGWRQAILSGWTIASTLITTTGERIWYTANCRGD